MLLFLSIFFLDQLLSFLVVSTIEQLWSSAPRRCWPSLFSSKSFPFVVSSPAQGASWTQYLLCLVFHPKNQTPRWTPSFWGLTVWQGSPHRSPSSLFLVSFGYSFFTGWSSHQHCRWKHSTRNLRMTLAFRQICSSISSWWCPQYHSSRLIPCST